MMVAIAFKFLSITMYKNLNWHESKKLEKSSTGKKYKRRNYQNRTYTYI